MSNNSIRRIATHRRLSGEEVSLIYDQSDKVVFIGKGLVFTETPDYFRKVYTPITLSCPYCHSDIHQNERVECKCGFVAIAQPPDIITLMKRMDNKADSLGSTIAYCNEIPIEGYFKSIDCHYVGMLENHKATTLLLVFYINEIHWLELKEGKAE